MKMVDVQRGLEERVGFQSWTRGVRNVDVRMFKVKARVQRQDNVSRWDGRRPPVCFTVAETRYGE